MKNIFKEKFKIISIILTILLLFQSIFFVINILREGKEPSKIYSQTINSIVELKSTNDNSSISYGTAILYNKLGYLITNAHVVIISQGDSIKEYNYYSIRFSSEEEYRSAELIKYDTETDLAILKINDITNIKITPITVGKSNDLKAGDKVFAIGNALNQGLSFTQGIISIPLINITYNNVTRNMIQSDIVISEGNSGGALLDKNGRLIGVTTFRLKDNNGLIIYGLAYSIPIESINAFFNDAIN